MPVEMTSCVILALKKEVIPYEKKDELMLKSAIMSYLGILFEKLGMGSMDALTFSLEDRDVEDWLSFYGVDVKDLIEDYYILISEMSFYDSGSWERPPPEEEELLKDSFYWFFHKEYADTDHNIKLIGDELILVSSYSGSP